MRDSFRKFKNRVNRFGSVCVCEFVEDDGGAFVVYYTFITTDNMRMQKIAFTGSGGRVYQQNVILAMK